MKISSSLKANRAPFGKLIVSDFYDSNIKYLVEKKAKVGGENLIDAKASLTLSKDMLFLFDLILQGHKNLEKQQQKMLVKDLLLY